MHRWATRFFALTTLGPVIVWAGCFAGVMVLGGVYDCRINEAGAYPCDVHGVDLGGTAAMLGVLTAWGPLIFGPFVAVSGAAWALYTLIRHLRLRVQR